MSDNNWWLSFVPYHVAQDLVQHPPQTSPVGREQRFEAVVLFADVSGFTAISEALGSTGRIGSEELTDILNRYFAPMISLITSYGGIIGKFGGDAMTVLFPYRSPANTPLPFRLPSRQATVRRAIQCGLAMQSRMSAYAAIETSAGVFSLRMKAGLALGSIFCTSVGDKERLEYLIAGKALDLCAEAEHHAQQGEVVVHQELVDILAPQFEFELPGEPPTPDPALSSSKTSGYNLKIVEERDGFSVIGQIKPWLKPASLPPINLPAAFTDGSFGYEAAYLPASLARLLAGGQNSFINEHRRVTVLFVNFAGFDYEADPRIGAKLQSYLGQVIALIRRYDGYLNKVDMGDKGSKYIVLFGTPTAHEDDEERALSCALELIQQAQTWNDSLVTEAKASVVVKIGVNTGFVYAGLVGSSLRQEYTVMGDAVNLAARLMQAAQPSQILVSSTTHQPVTAKFRWQAYPPLRVKGKTEPVEVYAVLATKEAEINPAIEGRHYTLPMVGRQAELALLAGKIEGVRQGQGQIIGISAEAGMGKSRLAAELIKLAIDQDLTLLKGECLSYGTSINYLVWQNIWRGLFGLNPEWTLAQKLAHLKAELAAVDPQLVERLPLLEPVLNLPIPDTALTASLEPKLRKTSLEALLLDYLKARTARNWPKTGSSTQGSNPFLLVLEDCHWIDPLSQELLEIIARNLADWPILVVLLYRPTDATNPTGKATASYFHPEALARLPNFTEIRLAEFTPAEARQLIRLKLNQLFGDEAEIAEQSNSLIEQIIEKAQGNPFYLDELLNFIRDKGLDLTQESELELAQLELPDSLYSLIISRIDRLAETEKVTLKVASVLGPLFKASWLWAIYSPPGGTSQVRQQLEHLSQLELTLQDKPEPELEYLFKHVITQEVAYESLAYNTRTVLHEKIGQFIEEQFSSGLSEYLDLLAFHFGRSHNTTKQREYFWRAGEAAQSAYANTSALDYYRRLLPLLDDAEQTVILFKLGEVWQLSGKWAEAEEAYRQALELAQKQAQAPEIARCQRALGFLMHLKGNRAAALTLLEQARQGFEQLGDAEGISHALGNTGLVYAQQGDYTQALSYYQQQQELAQSIGFEIGVSAAIGNMGSVYRYQNDFYRAKACYEQKIALDTAQGKKPGVSIALGNLGIVYYELGDYSNTLDCYRRKLELDNEIGDRLSASKVIGNMGVIYQEEGEYPQALACHSYLLKFALENGDRRMVAICLGNLAEVYREQGQQAKAESLYALAVKLCRELKIPYALCEQLFNQAELYNRQANFGEAQSLNSEALALATQIGRKDIEFKARLLAIELQHQLGQISATEAGEAYRQLQKEPALTREQAATLYYLSWKQDGRDGQTGEQAVNLYRELYAATPKFEYRQRYTELSGETLPAPPQIPLPEMLSRQTIALEEQLDKVIQLLG